jgi:hypothetical protein
MAGMEMSGDVCSNFFEQRRVVSSENKHLSCLGLNNKVKCALDEVNSWRNGVFWDVTACGSCMNRRFPPKHRFLQEPHSVTFQKTPFFIVTVVETSNLKFIDFNYIASVE